MATWITKCLSALTVGGPSLVLCGGVIDWGQGTTEKLRGLDTWLSEAWKRGGGDDVEGKLESLKERLRKRQRLTTSGIICWSSRRIYEKNT